MEKNIQASDQVDEFYTSVEQRKSEVVKNLIIFTIFGIINIFGTFIVVSKYGYLGYFLLLIIFLSFFIGSFQIALMAKLKKGTEQAVWKFNERPQTYATDYQVGISEKILSLHFLETVIINPLSPNTCRVKVTSSIKNTITKKYTFEIDLSLDQIDLFCECLTRHGVEKNQIQNNVQAKQSLPACA